MLELLDRLQLALADRYRIERELGRGGTAVVFLAHDTRHDRPVAIKVLRPELALAVPSERFLREIRIAANLTHPHILPLYDSDGADGLLWYVMPFVEGESLRNRLDRERQLSIEDAVRICHEVSTALDRAHRNGIVHRDIKPGNILLQGGFAIVSDFGIARAISVAGGDPITITGSSVGTPTYMSPEQAAGAQDLDGRSDIYSLGCVLYEMLAGHPPFRGDTHQEVIARHMIDPVPSLRAARRSISDAIESAVVTALAKEPADRFATALEFANALTAPGVMDKTREALADGPWGSTRGEQLEAGAEPLPDRSAEYDHYPQPSAEPSALPGIPVLRAGIPQPRRVLTLRQERPVFESLAVLPFSNESGDAEGDYLSDGITESIINRLSGLSGLRVVPRSVVFQYKGRTIDPAVVGSEVRARAVVTGRVFQHRETLIVKAELVDAATESQLWGEQYHRRLADIFDVQEDMASQIARALRIQLTGAEAQGLARRYTESPDAYRQYLKGRFHWNRRTEDGIRLSVDHLRRALEYDDRFALALAGLADAYVTLGIYGVAAPNEVMPLAKAAADHALAIDQQLAEALVPRACAKALFDWDWAGAERDFRRSLEINPLHPTGHQWYGVNCLAPQGRFVEAHSALRRALELDPVSPAIGTSVGLLFQMERRHERASEEYLNALRLDPHFGLAHYFLGLCYSILSRHDDALSALNRAVELTRESPESLSALGYATARAGNATGARQILGRLRQTSEHRYVSPVLLSLIHIALGDYDIAFEGLRKGYEVHSTELVWLGTRAVFDEIRSDPRFDELLRRVGLTASVGGNGATLG